MSTDQHRLSWRTSLPLLAIVAMVVGAIVYVVHDPEPPPGDRTAAAAPVPEQPAERPPSTHTRDRAGAKQAALDRLAALGGTKMYAKTTRDQVIRQVFTDRAAKRLRPGLTQDYARLARELDIDDADGKAPRGARLISRTLPVEVTVQDYGPQHATVQVWATSIFGLAGPEEKKELKQSWFTATVELTWTGQTWKFSTLPDQTSGPEPDEPAKIADTTG